MRSRRAAAVRRGRPTAGTGRGAFSAGGAYERERGIRLQRGRYFLEVRPATGGGSAFQVVFFHFRGGGRELWGRGAFVWLLLGRESGQRAGVRGRIPESTERRGCREESRESFHEGEKNKGRRRKRKTEG